MEPVAIIASLLNTALSVLRIVKDNKKDSAAEKEKKKEKMSAVIQPTLNDIKRYGKQLPRTSEVREELEKMERQFSVVMGDSVDVRKRAKKAATKSAKGKRKGATKRIKK